MDGGSDRDVISFANETSGVQVDLGTGAATAGAGSERFTSVEGVTGGSGDDTLVGTDRNNYLAGNGGDDTLRGLGLRDILDGDTGHCATDVRIECEWP